MFSTTPCSGYALTVPRTASTATTNNTFDTHTPNVNSAQRRLFAPLAGPTPDDAEDLLHPRLYPVPAISKHGRQARQASFGLRQEQGFPAAALASVISRKMPTLAQILAADAEDMEDANALFALIARTSATVRVPEFSYDAFAGVSALGDVSRPYSRGSSFSSASSSSCSSFDYDSEEDLGFEADEGIDADDAASVSSVESVESCFDFLASTRPRSQPCGHSSPATHIAAPVAPHAWPAASAAFFVPPQVRTHMNMLRFSRARAHSSVSNDSSSSDASSRGSWRSSASSASATSSRTSISSMLSVSPTPVQKATSVSTPAPTPALESKATTTKYLYQGGVSTVLGGGVMLGGVNPKPQQSQSRQAQKTTPRGSTSTYSVSTITNTTATAPSWRRGAPSAPMFLRA